MKTEIKDLAEMDTDDLYKQLGMKKRFAELSLMKDGTLTKNPKTVENFKFDTDTASLGIVSDSLSKLVQIGKEFFENLSGGAYNICCKTADGSNALKELVGKGKDAIIVAVTALLVANLAIAAAIAAIVAAIIVKLFFDAGGKVVCDNWKNSLPAITD